jgi:hypothetical protein
MLEELPSRYPAIRAFVWYDVPGHGGDWPIETSRSAIDAFAAGISSPAFLQNSYADLAAGPIRPAP